MIATIRTAGYATIALLILTTCANAAWSVMTPKQLKATKGLNTVTCNRASSGTGSVCSAPSLSTDPCQAKSTTTTYCKIISRKCASVNTTETVKAPSNNDECLGSNVNDCDIDSDSPCLEYNYIRCDETAWYQGCWYPRGDGSGAYLYTVETVYACDSTQIGNTKLLKGKQHAVSTSTQQCCGVPGF